MNIASPKLVLCLAILLPGAGHVALGLMARACTFLFFMLVLGWATSRLAPPQASFIGQHAGGFFVYALSLTDAYRIAALRRARAAA